MGKRIAIALVFVLVSGLVILGYFLHQGRKVFYTDPYKAVTPDAAIVIESIDLQSFFNSLSTETGMPGEAARVSEFAGVIDKLRFIAGELSKPGFKKLTGSSSTVLSFHPAAEGRLEPFLAMGVPGEIRWRQLREILSSSGIKVINDKMLAGNNILELPFSINNQEDTVRIAVVNGLLLCSLSGEIIEEAILQISLDNDIRSAPGFRNTLNASGKNEDKIFIIPGNLRKLVASSFKDQATLPGKIAGTIEGDIYIDENGLVLSGYAETNDVADILYRFKTGIAGSFHTYKVLPAATALFETIILSTPEPALISENQKSNPASSLALSLREYIGEEITKVYIDQKGRPVKENRLVIYELTNRLFAEELFLENIKTAATGVTEISWFRPDEQLSIPVYRLPFKGFGTCILPGFIPDMDDYWFAFYDNFLISGSSFNTIAGLIYDNLLNKTLANDMVYREFESTLPSVAGYYFYCVPGRIIDYLKEYLKDDLVTRLILNKGSLEKIQAIGYQLVPSNDMIYNSLSVRYREEGREESTTDWETLLDTVAAIKPFFFTNHLTGAREIFIQDMKNNAYLINSAGRVLWKVPLGERINGNVFMIDYYRNGKFQLLFAGKNNLHLLDRNGNYVERYPVRMRSAASSPMALFDYDNNRDYRLLVAGEDRVIYAYDKTGSIVKGWKLFKTNGFVQNEISWFRVSGKDYLVIADQSSLYFLDRTGGIRLNVKEPVTKAKGSALRLIPGKTQAVVCSSPDGTIQHIYFDGSVKKSSFRQFSPDHTFDVFDIDADGFGEYIYIDKGILYLYDQDGSEMFTREFGSAQLGGPISFTFATSDRKIGVYDIYNKLIYLIDKNGNSMDGFPLRGASMFSIGKLSDKSDWHLIVGGTDRFLYNYKLNADN